MAFEKGSMEDLIKNVTGWEFTELQRELRQRTYRDIREFGDYLDKLGLKAHLLDILCLCDVRDQILAEELEIEVNSDIGQEKGTILYKADEVHFNMEICVYLKDKSLTVDYWYINDRYEDEKWLYVTDENLDKLMQLLGVNENKIEEEIKRKFGSNEAYNKIQAYLDQHGVEYTMQRKSDTNPKYR